MERHRLKTMLGLAMVLLGIVQAALFASQSEWVPTGFGLLYSTIGIVYLWVEVYAVE
ncbi:hypothetical protein [Haloarchaeobius sp. HME9146]|uniref:hypothetical protein n=1 Tax=Haloarchaeobius sp. HME9146 TaxID=2978732 RepID=UPI0021C23FE4|nr:hypothetical protein [Haloarchaeobius sp. HME9146]MCT9096106.1 hypothetical protein [Haloarchaeobius sp. HME9146]